MAKENRRAIALLIEGLDRNNKPLIRPTGGTEYLYEAESENTVEGIKFFVV